MPFPPLLPALKPGKQPWQRQRVMLNLLAFSIPLLILVLDGHQQQAAMFSLGVFYTLLLDMGEKRLHRLENMALGIAALCCGFVMGLQASEHHQFVWWLGLFGFVVLGYAFNGGIALEMLLRYVGIGYLIGKAPSLLPVSMLPPLLYGACWTMAVSILFAPRRHNPTPLPSAPLWRHDLRVGLEGRFAGLAFGITLAMAVAVGMGIATTLHVMNPALVGITTLLVLRPDHERTLLLLWQRFAGVTIASLISLLVFESFQDPLAYTWLAFGCCLLLPLAFSCGMAWFTLCNTFVLMMLLGILGLHGQGALQMLEFRVLDTLLGSLCAGLAGWLLLMLVSKRQAREASRH